MLFNSLAFAIFLPLVFSFYWGLADKFRWIILLIASYYFYMSWNVKYVFLILFTTVVSFFTAILLEKAKSVGAKKAILLVSAFSSLGVLFYFKYFNFISQSIVDFLNCFSIKMEPFMLNVILPVGISFYTFQTLSYVIDVYKGDVKAEKHFGYYATFISFFPQLVAGPIERTKNLLPQIKSAHVFNYEQATYGLKLMAWGFFKKLVIADTLSSPVKLVFDNPQEVQGFALILASFFFTIQIYCDFSGYSDIAIGTAKLFGIDLMTNFKNPYLSKSIKEFWSRWHISLSTWFRDYVYIPLGGNRVGHIRHNINLMITFLVSGLWHGANWTFVTWGGIHGLAQILENIIGKNTKANNSLTINFMKTVFTFTFCMCAWVFFVSKSLGDACYVFLHMFDGVSAFSTYLKNGLQVLHIDNTFLYRVGFSLIMLLTYDYLSMKRDVLLAVESKKGLIRWSVYILLTIWILFNIPYDNTTEFIYFQF